MKKNLFAAGILVLSLAISISGCKKDNTTTTGGNAPIPSNTTYTATPLTYSLSATGDVSGSYNGLFIEELVPIGTITISAAAAQFCNTATPVLVSVDNLISPTASVTSVYCNHVKLQYDASGIDYTDTTNTLTFSPAVWTVNGAGTIPTFTYSCNTPFATYTNAGSLPATVNRAQNLTLSLSGSAGYDQAELSVDDGGNGQVNIFTPITNSSVTFVKDSLTRLAATTTGNITITLIKYNPQQVNNKNFLFITASFYTKSNVTIQ